MTTPHSVELPHPDKIREAIAVHEERATWLRRLLRLVNSEPRSAAPMAANGPDSRRDSEQGVSA